MFAYWSIQVFVSDLYQDMEIALPEIQNQLDLGGDELFERLNSQDSHYTDCTSESNVSDWEDYDAYYAGEDVSKVSSGELRYRDHPLI